MNQFSKRTYFFNIIFYFQIQFRSNRLLQLRKVRKRSQMETTTATTMQIKTKVRSKILQRHKMQQPLLLQQQLQLQQQPQQRLLLRKRKPGRLLQVSNFFINRFLITWSILKIKLWCDLIVLYCSTGGGGRDPLMGRRYDLWGCQNL